MAVVLCLSGGPADPRAPPGVGLRPVAISSPSRRARTSSATTRLRILLHRLHQPPHRRLFPRRLPFQRQSRSRCPPRHRFHRPIPPMALTSPLRALPRCCRAPCSKVRCPAFLSLVLTSHAFSVVADARASEAALDKTAPAQPAAAPENKHHSAMQSATAEAPPSVDL